MQYVHLSTILIKTYDFIRKFEQPKCLLQTKHKHQDQSNTLAEYLSQSTFIDTTVGQILHTCTGTCTAMARADESSTLASRLVFSSCSLLRSCLLTPSAASRLEARPCSRASSFSASISREPDCFNSAETQKRVSLLPLGVCTVLIYHLVSFTVNLPLSLSTALSFSSLSFSSLACCPWRLFSAAVVCSNVSFTYKHMAQCTSNTFTNKPAHKRTNQ